MIISPIYHAEVELTSIVTASPICEFVILAFSPIEQSLPIELFRIVTPFETVVFLPTTAAGPRTASLLRELGHYLQRNKVPNFNET